MKNLLLILALFSSNFLLAHINYLVEIDAKTTNERSIIAQHISIDHVTHDRVFSVVSLPSLRALSKDPRISILKAEAFNEKDLASPFPTSDYQFPAGEEAFHTYKELEKKLFDWQKEFAGIVKIFSLGKTYENRDIWAVKISDDVETDNNKPSIAFLATHHAREHISTEMPILFLERFLESYDTNNELKGFIKDLNIYVIPMVNPDGAMYDVKNRRYKWWRKNRRDNRDGSFGVDLNRNYAFGWNQGGSSSSPHSDVYMGPEAFSEPETKAIRDFFLARPNITTALSFHTFSELILYPWSYKYDQVLGEDLDIFTKMANDMAAMNNYKPQQASELYIASGETCDYLYGQLSVFCFTFELSPSSIFGGGFYPGASAIQRTFEDNYEPMLYLIRAAKDPKKALHW